MGNSLVLLAVVVFGAILVLGWGAGAYNALVRSRNAVSESWADIDTELHRRHDLIPNLVETVKGYAAHERDTFERVIQARNAAASAHSSKAEQAKDENALAGSVRQLFALAESYPELKANQNFIQLQEELANTEDRLQRARRFYHANVRDLDNRIETFPSNIVASLFSFKPAEYFEVDDPAIRQAPAVKF